MVQDRLFSLWQDFLRIFCRKFDKVPTTLWFGEAVPIAIQNGTLFLLLDSDFKRDVLAHRYAEFVESYFTQAMGEKITLCLLKERDAKNISFFADNEAALLQYAQAAIEMLDAPQADATEAVFQIDPFTPSFEESKEEIDVVETIAEDVQQTASEVPSQPLSEMVRNENPLRFQEDAPLVTTDENGNHLDFEHFVVGNSNKFAHAACLAVAKEPAKQYNPLFIYGPSGLGKTHLLKSIIRYLQLNRPELKIRYVKGDEFTNQMIESISFNRTEQFRSNYRKVDVLLIDDIQFIAGKESTQEEFFHTFNALYEDQKQIILTSDRPPKDIPRLEERLKTRFEWGLTADIQPPDLELRVAILKNKSLECGIQMGNDVLSLIAENLRNNVRQLEGAVKKIAAQSLLLGQPITKELAFSCISDFMSGSEPMSQTSDKILSKIAQKYDISLEDIKGSKRSRGIAMPRHIAIYLIREMTNMSFPQLGKLFGRDHTTILNSYQTVVEKMKEDPFFEAEVKEFLRELQGS